MNSIQISTTAKNYADALKKLAQDDQISYDDILKNLECILEICKTSNDLQNVLSNPSISDETKFSIINDVFHKDIDKKIIDFVKVLIEKKRFNELSGITEAYKKVLDNIKNIQRVDVVSAISLNDNFKNRIEEKLQKRLNKNIIANWLVDEDIIGGLIVKVDDDIIDSSLKNKLENLSKNLI